MPKKKYIIPIFIPHKGCPNDCSFCNQKRIAGEGSEITSEEIREIIIKYIDTINKASSEIEVAFYGGSFTGLIIEKQKEYLEAVNGFIENGLIHSIRLSTRPDYISVDILRRLKAYGVTTIELGVQSTSNKVLQMNNRGHNREDVEKATGLIKSFGFSLGLQMMLGLYGDTKSTIMTTVEDFVNWKPDFVRVYPTIVIKDTYLEELYNKGKFKPISLEESIALGKEVLIRFKENNILVIRMGLQATDEITYGKGIVAGPYHPAYREMVETEIFRDKIQTEIDKQKISFSRLTIHCHYKDASKVAGYNKKNKEYFIEKYKLKEMAIEPYSHLEEGNIIIAVE